MNINMADKYCGLGNIVKGVKKRKKKSDPGHRNYAFPYDDQLRTNESVHTLLSKLDIVDKKLEKFDQSHPLPPHTQGVQGTLGVNQDNCYPKLQVQLPDNWLELMKDCQSHGNRPCLEVSVKSDGYCREEPQKGAPYSRRAAHTNSRSGRRSCSCEMARRNVLETYCGSQLQQSSILADQRNVYPTRSCNNRQYGTLESSLPCGESPNIMPLSKVPNYSNPPPLSTPMISRNISQGPQGSEECLETAPLDSPHEEPSELSERTPSISSNRNSPSVRPCIAWMESRCEEIDEEADHSNNNPYYAARVVQKQVEVEFDLAEPPGQKSPSTFGSYLSFMWSRMP
uniref:Putative serine/threonine-protein kinase KKQ8 n=1 Tax=Lygus hesperus TaxID=30085 RepID=A0A0A9VTL4_LYGHE